MKVKELQEKINWLKERYKKKDKILKEIEESGQSQISLTDPDSRIRCKNLKPEGLDFDDFIGYNRTHYVLDSDRRIKILNSISVYAVSLRKFPGGRIWITFELISEGAGLIGLSPYIVQWVLWDFRGRQ